MKNIPNGIPFQNKKKAQDLSEITGTVNNLNEQLAQISYQVKILIPSNNIIDTVDFQTQIDNGVKSFIFPHSLVGGVNESVYLNDSKIKVNLNNADITATGDFPIFRNADDNGNSERISIFNGVLRKPLGTHYHIELTNVRDSIIDKIHFYGNGEYGGVEYHSGVWFRVNSVTETGLVGVNYVTMCEFHTGQINMETFDSHIIENVIWAIASDTKYVGFGININGVNNAHIESNQIVGSRNYGSVWADNAKYCKIIGNYFDGNASNLISGKGIFGRLNNSTITGNTFWLNYDIAIHLTNSTSNSISNNIFYNNMRGIGNTDIFFTEDTGYNYANTVIGNTFFNSKTNVYTVTEGTVNILTIFNENTIQSGYYSTGTPVRGMSLLNRHSYTRSNSYSGIRIEDGINSYLTYSGTATDVKLAIVETYANLPLGMTYARYDFNGSVVGAIITKLSNNYGYIMMYTNPSPEYCVISAGTPTWKAVTIA